MDRYSYPVAIHPSKHSRNSPVWSYIIHSSFLPRFSNCLYSTRLRRYRQVNYWFNFSFIAFLGIFDSPICIFHTVSRSNANAALSYMLKKDTSRDKTPTGVSTIDIICSYRSTCTWYVWAYPVHRSSSGRRQASPSRTWSRRAWQLPELWIYLLAG